MRLYSGSATQFISDTDLNQIADKLKEAFFNYYRRSASPGEINSWRNSLRAMASVIRLAELSDHGVLLEYQLPLTSKRLDCMITGQNSDGIPNAIIVELKQWEICESSDGANEVLTYVGGAKRDVLHPSVQVLSYQTYLADSHTAFYDGSDPISLRSCSYLHNYLFDPDDPLFDVKFETQLSSAPVFTKDDVDGLSEFLSTNLAGGEGLAILKRVEESKYRPSKKLMDHVGSVIKGKGEYVLLDEQLIAYDRVFAELAKKSFHKRKKSAILVKGGPGTGKSVIAINLMADLLLAGYNAQYATGSRAFTETLRKVIGTRGSQQFKYFNSYREADPDAVDVLICDEAHRLRSKSTTMYMRKTDYPKIAQIEELFEAARVCVFLVDDDQNVRPDEIGSTTYIKDFAEKNDIHVYEFELEAQFRCAGSDGFINWINNTLGIRKTANILWDTNSEDFDFRIFNSATALEEAIREKESAGNTARMMAGFCWPWSKKREKDGSLVCDVQINDYLRPWNARPEATRLPPNVPKATVWAYESGGIDQIGCVYTAQGFEFDYAGIIFGQDIIYSFDDGKWKGQKENSYDNVLKRSGDQFLELAKNTYRILLSRGMKGCYVYFMDKETERFFRSRME